MAGITAKLPINSIKTLKKDIERIVEELAQEIYDELQEITPIDTGNLKQSWTKTQIENDFSMMYRLSNDANNYNYIIFAGRVFFNGRWYGSEQLPQGLAPYFIKWQDRLNEKLKGLR